MLWGLWMPLVRAKVQILASFVSPIIGSFAQPVKNLPAVQETWVQFLYQENPWRRKWQPTPVFLPGEFHGQRLLTIHGVTKSWT